MARPVRDTIIETSDRWLALLQWLAGNGALEPVGLRMPREEMVDATGIPQRSLARILLRMEELKILHIERSTIDGTFGAPRGPNRYRLLITPDQWDERAEAIVEQKIADGKAKQSAARKAHDQAARQGKKLIASGGAKVQRPATRVEVLDEATVAAMATHYRDVPDDELYGW